MTKIALGTAQFGNEYGVANSSGEVKTKQIKEILNFSSNHNINFIDTAMDYESSEKKLGNSNLDNFKIISKLPKLKSEIVNLEKWVRRKIEQSLENLKLNKIHGLLFHNPQDLLGSEGEKIYKILLKLKDEGLISKIGISIYSPKILEDLIPIYSFDIVQAPFNIIDNRIINSGWADKLNNMEIKIHVRSIFLQGLLLMPKEKIPFKFKKWISLFEDLESWSKRHKIDKKEICLSFVKKFSFFEKIIVGIDNLKQLEEISSLSTKPILKKFPDLYCDDELLIDPSKWNKL
tara:strand:+ start:4318 stop:5187 length:870 start_codon:yes stop_codon:yes gene_type:complete